ncbi:D-alanyl-D-alanine carboxypeptidase/D-alanyl-D-alanine-endopeptidase [Virgibacillus siamensis]|uniref:D-alanyl-D-alanine carboxypeptidase/D-alanyl-D-alanine-endopeptidase n=1 Tax=Virgibacillus siamensis TaxID=480071 RepID=A0ABN1GLJ7_9BACI
MTEELNSYIENAPDLKGAIAGISIRETSNGELVYEHMGDVRLRPASNMKLLTSAAALSILGKDYTFQTKVLTTGQVHGQTLAGDLILKGQGDPTLLPTDFDDFAQKIKASGINTINGNIIGDDTWYDDVRLSQDMIWTDEDWYYGAQVSALTASPDRDYDAGSVIIEVVPGERGEKPSVRVIPETNYVKVKNIAMTTDAGVEEDLTLNRIHGGNTIIMEGTIPAGSPNVKEWMAVWEPTGYALRLFKQSLQNYGISWNGEIITGAAPNNAEVLFTHKSMPLSELLMPLMKLSNNTIAEMLVKEMGKVVQGEGRWETGLEVMEKELRGLGINTDNLVIRDGSGISHADLVPPNAITKLLYQIQDEDWVETYVDALPVAGVSERMVGGTLRERMDDLNVKAKTGTIMDVSTLSGYVQMENGRKLIFSIMLNNLIDEEDGPEIEDKLVEMIADQQKA